MPQVEPKKGLKKGTPEGDKPLQVRVMKPCTYGPSPELERRYEIGDELTIPSWRYTSYHEQEVIKDPKTGRELLKVRGTFELADRPRPNEENVGKHSGTMQNLIDENETLRKKLAILESGAAPGSGRGKSKHEEI